MTALRGILTLLSAVDPPSTPEEEIAAARRDLDAALDALRRARAAWTSPHTADIQAVRAALDAAERQLDRARVRLQSALSRHDPSEG